MTKCKYCHQRDRHLAAADTYRAERSECAGRGDLIGRIYWDGLVRASNNIADDLFGSCICEDMRAEA